MKIRNQSLSGRSLLPIMPLLRRLRRAPCTRKAYISEPKTSMKGIRGRKFLTDRNALAICATRARKILAYTDIGGFFASRSSANMKGVYGRSMIEMLGVLAIIGVLSAGGIWAYSAAMENYKVNKHFSDLKQMAINLQGIFNKPSKSSQSLPILELKGRGLLVDNYEKEKSVWGTPITLSISGYIVGDGDIHDKNNVSVDHSYYRIYTRLYPPSEAVCRKILAFDIQKYFEGFKIRVAGGAGDQYQDKLSQSKIITQCKLAKTQPNTFYIVWRIYWNHKKK